jgi:hypothetical protein
MAFLKVIVIDEIRTEMNRRFDTPIHQLALVVNGVHLLERLRLDELAAKKVYELTS